VSVPEEALPELLSPGERFAGLARKRIREAFLAFKGEELEPIVKELIANFAECAAQLAEEIARPDDRWGPQ
jgi:hypothetical protein